MVERQKIAKLVDNLNHPDTEQRRQYMRKLVEIGAEAVPVLNANLTLVEQDVRPSLVRVLGEIRDDRSLLPLMRFVFDSAGEPGEGDARGLAMQAIMQIADEDQADRLFDFLVDMKDDDDTFVRGYVIEAFGRLGDKRAMPFVEEALEDSDDFVRECAQRALEALEDAESDSLKSTLDGRELLQKIRISTGSELEYYMNELFDRDDAFELAVRLIREDDRDTMRGLRALQKIGDPRAREVARRQFKATQSTAAKAVCLRLLAEHIDADADEEEVNLIRRSLKHGDPFISLAALQAAGVSGDRGLIRKTLKAVESSDLNRAETAAEALSKGLTPENVRLLPNVVDTFDVIHNHRINDDAPEYVRIEAYLLRGLTGLVEEGGMGTSDAQEAALTALRGAADARPILITALTLLDETVPKEGLDTHERWSEPEASALLEILDHANDSIARRALDIVYRGIGGAVEDLSHRLSRHIYEDPEILLDRVIPLLERAADRKARELLDELTQHADDDVQKAADQALRRLRDSDTTLDASFE